MIAEFTWRAEVRPSDVAAVRDLVTRTGVFTPDEISIAAELVEDRLADGDASGYHFVIAERAGNFTGFACFGPIAGTESAFDLYWIAVDPGEQGGGVGRALLEQAEAAMRAMGASRHYAETSSTEAYAPTRAFYLATSFREVARIADFYRPGDGKVIYERVL